MITITRKRLEWLCNFSGREEMEDIDGSEIKELAQLALASLDAEPVAYVIQDKYERQNDAPGYLSRSHVTKYVSDDDIQEHEITCTPLYTAPPAPVVVPEPIKRNDADGWWMYKGRRVGGGCAEWYNRALDDCRAAMLQSFGKTEQVEPVSETYKLPSREHFISLCNQFWNWQEFDEINAGVEESRLEWDGKEFTHRVTQALWRIYQAASTGNSPAIQDSWVKCSDRMPEMGEEQTYVLAADFKNHYWPNLPNKQVGVFGDWFSDGNPTWDDGDGNDLHLKEVTHWMTLPAAPRPGEEMK